MQVTMRTREARPGHRRILRTLQGALVGRPIYWRLLKINLVGQHPFAGPYAGVYGKVLKPFLVGGDNAQLLFSWPSVATLFFPS